MNSNDYSCAPTLRSLEVAHAPPEYRVSLTLSVSDVTALWASAAARLLAAPGAEFCDVVDVIGPREDPSICECIAALARPAPVVGCALEDFSVDCIESASERPDVTIALPDVPAEPVVVKTRRAPAARRPQPALRLCAPPAPPMHARTN